ncbi:MAG: hypothetical protein ACE5GS_05825 [Kiloniellaceae bacterium]
MTRWLFLAVALVVLVPAMVYLAAFAVLAAWIADGCEAVHRACRRALDRLDRAARAARRRLAR